MGILSMLEQERVFSIDSNRDGTWEICEECDCYYGVTLTADQMLQLSEEIRSLCMQSNS